MTEIFAGVGGAIKKLFEDKKTAEEKALVTFYTTKDFMSGEGEKRGRGHGLGVTVMRKKSESVFLPPERTTALISKNFSALFSQRAEKVEDRRYSTESELWARERVCLAILETCNPL